MDLIKFERPKSVMVTGAGGHLGGKAVEALVAAPWCERIVAATFGNEALELSEHARRKVDLVRADLTRTDGTWDEALSGVDALIHFAASNPVPDSSWAEAQASFDMTLNVGLASLRHGVRRLVFCSSNHVMGGYKDPPLAACMGPGLLTTSIPAAPGTHWTNGARTMDSTAYAASKIFGERCVASLVSASGGRLSVVSIRIGWALPGNNCAASVNLSGSPNATAADEGLDEAGSRALRWFRGMWLSNGDFHRLVEASLTADPARWPSPAVVVNGVSGNAGMDWSIVEGRDWLGYDPQDDLYAALRAS